MKIHVIITMIALVVFLIAAIWYAKKKYKINLSVLGLGAVAFFVSSQVLEKIVHLLVLHPQKDGTISLMQEHPFLYVLYMVREEEKLRRFRCLSLWVGAWRFGIALPRNGKFD